MTRTHVLAWIAAVSTAATLAAPPDAHACGGFFCSNTGPVIQQAERIVFVDHGDGRITTVVQVQYAGPSERFSWIVPIPGIPEVSVSSNAVFQQLDVATAPRFQLTVEDACQQQSFPTAGGAVDAGTSADSGAAPPSGVEVLASGSVGPFDYEVIRPDPNLPDPAAVAVTWLEDNGYDVGAIGPDLLRPYLAMNQNLVAFRLQKTASTGDIRPVVLSYRAERPLIPIQLTAVAARPDMGVLVWVVGPERAVPLNYLSLEPNLALVDWFRGGRNWNDVVTAAANEAGGQGFVTEFARPNPGDLISLWPGSRARSWDAIRAEPWQGRELDLLRQVNNLFRGWDGLMGAYERFVPVPADTTLRDFLNCPRCFGADDPALPGLDVPAFIAAVEEDVVDPVRESETLLSSGAYLTRLYTTLSPEEMTRDPSFAFNPDLSDVDNVHRATARRQACDVPFEVELEDGRTVRANRNQAWPFLPFDGSVLPANDRILRVGLEGPGEVVVDNGPRIDATLAPPQTGSGSCQTGPDRSGGLLALVTLTSAAWLSRRRRRGAPRGPWAGVG